MSNARRLRKLLDDVMPDLSEAACKETDLELWFPHDVPDPAEMRVIDGLREVCASCPVLTECLSYALKHERWGIWGGMTATERGRLLRMMGKPEWAGAVDKSRWADATHTREVMKKLPVRWTEIFD